MLQVRRMQGARLAREEPLGGLSGVPQVEVSHLRPFDAVNPEEMAGWNTESLAVARRHDDLVNCLERLARGAVQRHVGRRQRFVGVADDGANSAA